MLYINIIKFLTKIACLVFIVFQSYNAQEYTNLHKVPLVRFSKMRENVHNSQEQIWQCKTVCWHQIMFNSNTVE